MPDYASQQRLVVQAMCNAEFSGHYRKRRHQLDIPCPFCGDDRGHFAVNLQKLLFNCWECHASGCLSHSSFTPQETLALQRLRNQSAPIDEKPTQNRALITNGYSVCDVVFSQTHVPLVSALAAKAYEWCLRRGVTVAQMRDYRVYVKPYCNRVFFPVWNEQQQVVFYVGRSLGDEKPKTLEPTDSAKPLFGRHVRKHEEWVVLVEGVFDHFSTPQSYAVLGSSINPNQAEQLHNDGIQRVLLIGDPDATVGMHRSLQVLAGFRILSFPVYLFGTDKDPNDLGSETMHRVVRRVAALVHTLNRSQTVNVDVHP